MANLQDKQLQENSCCQSHYSFDILTAMKYEHHGAGKLFFLEILRT